MKHPILTNPTYLKTKIQLAKSISDGNRIKDKEKREEYFLALYYLAQQVQEIASKEAGFDMNKIDWSESGNIQ